jgi:two-component system sensor histidine kinase UhpB
MSLMWRVFVINAGLMVVATLALALSPATVSSELLVHEVVVLTVGLALVLVLNFLLIRRSLDPLERLSALMQRVDLLRPGTRIPQRGGGREVTELAGAFNEMLERLEGERRESGRRAIQAQEHERRRIALELHDEVGQLLTGVVLSLDGLTRTVDPDVRAQLEQVQDLVREGVEQVRALARRLRPEALEELGLRSALIGLSSSVSATAGIRVVRHLTADLPRLSPDVELVVYRVAQESLTNVMRHADATSVDVGLERVDGGLQLCIADDGRGIDSRRIDEGRGIAGMVERAVYVGGRLDVEPRSPTGTAVTLRVPITGGSP